MLPRRSLATLLVAGSLSLIPVVDSSAVGEEVLPDRSAQPVVLTGAQLPDWSRLPATGTANPTPSPGVSVRDAHNGELTVPPDSRTGVPVEQIVAHRWDGSALVEIPVQVDQRFPYFLANANSDFSVYSGTDMELTYQWDVESWKMTAGECRKEYEVGDGPTQDLVPTLDDDDEIVFMASDLGAQAPAGTLPGAQEIAVTDPTSGPVGFVYLSLSPTGPSITDGYVSYVRDENADEYIDRNTFAPGDTEQLGSSNTGYGPNLGGTVCTPDLVSETEVALPRHSTDRFPRDGVTVTTDKYKWYASGRWMVREMHVANGERAGGPPPWSHASDRGRERGGRDRGPSYGPDLIDRWKGRAFQQSPDSSISVVGFEDEQVNWEANSTLLGERVGPVRAIRETWGADSGTNVTKTETFYRDAITYRYRVRVHPIPPDGLYTSWDYNAGVASTYYNALKPDGVTIDGLNDDVGQVDELPLGTLGALGVNDPRTDEPVEDVPAFFDAPDPTFNAPLTMFTWEQVSGAGDAGSLVYVLENKSATSLANPLVVPYYRDDMCLDDGTGDDPVARPWPGESSTDDRVEAAYAGTECDERQGAWGSHGVHYFVTHDTDNAFIGNPAPINEIDAQQWQFAVPTESPRNVGEPYAQLVRVPLVAVARPAR